jgi:hypothetical protein
LLTLLERRAPGARVLEVGCGSGLLSCIAARMGAARVYAVEPTTQVELARELVARNRLEDVVEVIEGLVQDVAPRPVDLAFSELLNADPFAEGLLGAMDAASSWVVDGGLLAPRRLRLWLALVRENTSAREVADVRQVLQGLASGHDLDLDPIVDGLASLDAYRSVSPQAVPITRSHCVLDLPLGTGERPPAVVRVEIPVESAGPVGGAFVWFEAEIDEGLSMSNGPENPGHWGHLVSGWATEVGGAKGGTVTVDVHLDPAGGVHVQPV